MTSISWSLNCGLQNLRGCRGVDCKNDITLHIISQIMCYWLKPLAPFASHWLICQLLQNFLLQVSFPFFMTSLHLANRWTTDFFKPQWLLIGAVIHLLTLPRPPLFYLTVPSKCCPPFFTSYIFVQNAFMVKIALQIIKTRENVWKLWKFKSYQSK